LKENFLPGKVGLAPMAGITDYPFRKICFEYGAPFAFTEMISAKSVLLNLEVNEQYFPRSDERERIGIQLFGYDPVELAQAAQMVQDKALWVDLNAGCPATKIVKRNAGAALLKDLKHFRLVVREMKKVTRRLSVKTRIGWDRDEFEHIYNILVEEGVDAIFVHGRTARQMYAGKASWNIYNHGDVPMYLSGDIYTREDIKRAIEVSGASGVIVARGSIGNPWIFSSLKDTGRNENVDKMERLNVVLRHLDYLEIEYGDYGAVVFRKYVAGYTKTLVGAREFRANVMNLDTIEKLKESFIEYFSKLDLERSSEYTSTGGNLE